MKSAESRDRTTFIIFSNRYGSFAVVAVAIVLTLLGISPVRETRETGTGTLFDKDAVSVLVGPRTELFKGLSMKSDTNAQANERAGTARLRENYGRLPLSFEANQGQTDRSARFVSRGSGYNLFLTPTEAVLSLRSRRSEDQSPESRLQPPDSGRPAANASAVLRMSFVGANPAPEIVGINELPGKNNYFIGNDPAKWRTNIPNYAKVKYESVYPGVDLVYYGNQRQLEYDFVVAPGADPAVIRLSLKGARKITVDDRGDLVLGTNGADVRWRKPIIYQEIDGRRTEVEGSYALLADSKVAFNIGAYDNSKPLVIDPVLVYSTFLGGSGDDGVYEVAVDGSGNAFLTGYTGSMNFPTSVGAHDTSYNGGAYDAFVTKLNNTGTAAIFSTYFGGRDVDQGDGIAVDASGNVYVGGLAKSDNFPTTAGAYDTTCTFCGSGGAGNPPGDAFVAKFDPTGILLNSTLYGAGDYEVAHSLALDTAGNVYIGGGWAGGFCNCLPLAGGGFQGKLSYYDSFLAKFNSDLSSLLYATVIGGNNDDYAVQGIASSSPNIVSITGVTRSTNFPTSPGAFDSVCGTNPVQHNGIFDAFVMKIDTSTGAVPFSTCLGGSGDEGGSGIAIDGAGNLWVTGGTPSADFPTTPGAYDTTHNGLSDVFVTKLDPTAAGAAQVVYSTFLGGGNNDGGAKIALDGIGDVYVAGSTSSSNFPTVLAPQGHGGLQDAFLSKLNPGTSMLSYSTYLGSCLNDAGTGLALDSSGNAFIGGISASSSFPVTAGAFQTLYGGTGDGFVTKLGPGIMAPYDPCPAVSPTPIPTPTPITTPTATPFTDTDGDGFPDFSDNCPTTPNASQADSDLDSYGDACDACPTVYADAWSQKGPNGRISYSLALNPVTTTTVYTGTDDGVFKSVDSGTTWTQSNVGFPLEAGVWPRTAFALVHDPQNTLPGILYVGVDVGDPANVGTQVLRSTDGGASWTGTSLPNVFGGVQEIVLDPAVVANPATDRTLYVGAMGDGVWKTTNSGATFAKVGTVGAGLTDQMVQGLALAQSSPNILYAGTNLSGVFKSIDSGVSWTSVSTGLPTTMVSNFFSVLGLAVDPSDPSGNTVFAGTGGGGVYKTVNGGATWTDANNGIPAGNPRDVRSLALDPLTPATIYAGTFGGVYKSTDGGSNWVAFNNGVLNTNVFPLAIDPVTTGILYAGTSGDAVYRRAPCPAATPTPTPCVPPPSNMVNWWPGDGNANDIQGANNGTLQGNTGFSSGKVDQAFSFDGSGDYVDVGDADLGTQFTIDAWIKPDSFANAPMIISKPTGAYQWFIRSNSTPSMYLDVINANNQQTRYESAPSLVVGQWQHVAVTYNGTAANGDRIHFYVNGQSIATSTVWNDSGGTPINDAAAATIGRSLSVGQDFDGLIDEVEIFDRALTVAEIAPLYNAGSAGKCKPAAPPDTDNDGVPDANDNCPAVANTDQADGDGDLIGDACDPDDDNDGVADGVDNCPLTSNAAQTNTDGDAMGDACDPDDDNDGVADGTDNCQFASNPGQANNDGDAQGDVCDPDDDNDGDLDGADNCPLTANPDQTDTDSDGQGDACDLDDDNDGVADGTDNCPLVSNMGQPDSDNDLIGDACDPDDDNDGVLDGPDNCETTVNPGQQDQDLDGIGDACDADIDGDGVDNGPDNCDTTVNPGQQDQDLDGIGDACDADDDNDGDLDEADNCPLFANPDQADHDSDAIGDVCDTDDDNDGVLDGTDNCQFASNPGQANNDNDSMGDVCDTDDDNDGVADTVDNCPLTFNPTQADNDSDGTGDVCDPDDDNDTAADLSDNCQFVPNPNQANNDGDALGDVCDPDDDNDGVADGADNCPFASNSAQTDTDGDGQGDACDADDDNDGVLDGADNCQFMANIDQANNDGDAQGDVCDPDDDNDGDLDGADNCPLTANPDQTDTNGDGVGDLCTASQPPAGGQFVLGDLANMTGGATVNFWGAQWSQNNPMSGGPAPNAFKGFENGLATPTCGQRWTSQPGNSSSPPPTVPEFMTVLVSSSITKNGSVITGNVTRVVVVQTDPGYGPSPGHRGTGKVVAILCGGP